MQHLLQPGRHIGDEKLVGARVGRRAATRTQGTARALFTATSAGQLLGNVVRLGVIHLERLGSHRLKVEHRHLGLEFKFFLGQDFILGRDPDHVFSLAHAQTLGLQNDVQRLIPRHILQSQGYRAGHGIGGDDVEVRKVGNHLQQRTNLDVLEVERELLPAVTRPLSQFGRVDFQRLDFNHELLVALVSTVDPLASGLNHHAYAVTCLECRHRLHRRREISHIQAPAHALGQARLHELNNQGLPLLANIDTNLVIGQTHNNAPRAFLSATEIHVLERQIIAIAALGKNRRHGCRRRATRHRFKHDQQGLALQLRFIRRCLLEIENDTRALTHLHHIDGAQIALIDLYR